MAKIMLVEDDKSLQEIYSIRLVAEGYDIARADDGEEALAKAVQEKPDLIIADVMMPKISGFDMLDILRSQPETQNIKVIMMTALSSDDQRQRGEALGAERYLVKSQVGIEDVINTVHEVLGDKPKGDAKANIETLSNVPNPQQPAPAAPAAPGAAPAIESVPTTPTTTIQPTNPAAGPAPMPGQPNPNGGMPTNFNQAPVAMPGMIPGAQAAMNPAAGAFAIPATQIAGGFPMAAPQIPQYTPTTVSPTVPLPMPPAQTQGTALQMTDRILPNAQLSAAIQAAEAMAQNQAESAPIEDEKTSGGERVIQPIHDPRLEQQRDEMQQRMAEILGEDADASGEPQMVTTKTARRATNPAPAPAVPKTANKEQPPVVEQDPVKQAQNVTLAPDTNSQQDLVRSQIAAQPEPVAEESIQSTGVAQAQAVQAETQQIAAAEESEQQAAVGEEEIIEPIQPGYITELENQISEETLQEKEATLANRMADELKDDDITLQAQQKAVVAAAAAAELAAQEQKNVEQNRSEEIEQAVGAALASPNIAAGEVEETPGPAPAPQAAPVPAPAPQPQAAPQPQPAPQPAPQAAPAPAPQPKPQQVTPAPAPAPAAPKPAAAPAPQQQPAPQQAPQAPLAPVRQTAPKPITAAPAPAAAPKPAAAPAPLPTPPAAPRPIVRSTANEVSSNIPH